MMIVTVVRDQRTTRFRLMATFVLVSPAAGETANMDHRFSTLFVERIKVTFNHSDIRTNPIFRVKFLGKIPDGPVFSRRLFSSSSKRRSYQRNKGTRDPGNHRSTYSDLNSIVRNA